MGNENINSLPRASGIKQTGLNFAVLATSRDRNIQLPFQQFPLVARRFLFARIQTSSGDCAYSVNGCLAEHNTQEDVMSLIRNVMSCDVKTELQT